MADFHHLDEEEQGIEIPDVHEGELAPIPPGSPKHSKAKDPPNNIKDYILRILANKVPIVSWLPNYKLRAWLKGDIAAGLTVGVMLIPQSMAYAMVAGLPPIYGLYSSIVPLILFGMFTTSKHLAVGPFAIISLLVGEAVSEFLGEDKYDDVKYIQTTILLTFLCGMIKILFGILRLGFLVNFLSDPVRSGFNSASAITIGASQLKHLFGVTIPTETFLWATLYDLAKALPKTNGWSFLIGIAGIAMLFGLKQLAKKYKVTIPGALIVVGLGTFLTWIANLEHKAHISVVGEVPSGFPPLQNPFVPNFWHSCTKLFPSAVIIVLVTFISAMSIASKFSEQFKYRVEANQEFLAMGIADAVGSVFSAFPLAASLSRTAVNVQSGAHTPLSGIFSTLLVIVALIFLAPVVYFIPRALLASIVLVAIVDIVEYQRVKELWGMHRRDLALLLLAFFATLVFGILQGLLIGVGASLFVILYRNAYPRVTELGRLPGTTTFLNMKRFPQTVKVPGLAVVRFDSSLYFANADHVRKHLRAYVAKNAAILMNPLPPSPPVKWVVLDCSSMSDIDSTAIRAIKESALELRNNDIHLFFACVKGPIRDAIKRCGVVGMVGLDHFFWSVHDAVNYYYISVLHLPPPSIDEELKKMYSSPPDTPREGREEKGEKGGEEGGAGTGGGAVVNAEGGERDGTEFSPFVFDIQENEAAITPLMPSISMPILPHEQS